MREVGSSRKGNDASVVEAVQIERVERDRRPGRIAGATVAFGAPGPRIDLDALFARRIEGATVSGGADVTFERVDAASIEPPPRQSRQRQTVDLSDGTRISFVAADDLF